MDLNEINKTIECLEKGKTTYQNCNCLASLYTVRDHMMQECEDDSFIMKYKMLKECSVNERSQCFQGFLEELEKMVGNLNVEERNLIMNHLSLEITKKEK